MTSGHTCIYVGGYQWYGDVKAQLLINMLIKSEHYRHSNLAQWVLNIKKSKDVNTLQGVIPTLI